MEKGLNELRAALSNIDEEIVTQFIQRMVKIDVVAEYKGQTQGAVFAPDQEGKVLEKIRSQMPLELQDYGDVLFKTLMRLSRERQYDLLLEQDQAWPLGKALKRAQGHILQVQTVVFPGTMESYSALAAKEMYPKASLVSVRSFASACRQVVDSHVDVAVLPLENSTASIVDETYFLLKKHALYIQACFDLEIRHALLGVDGTEYNQTRFIAVSPKLTVSPQAERVSLIIQTANEAGALAAVLNIFADLGLNLTKIQSRPIPNRPWDYSYYLDFLAKPESRAASRALYQLEQETQSMRLLGWYHQVPSKPSSF